MVKTGVLEQVPVADIQLDRTNPRIRKFLEMYPDAPTAEQIYLALGAAGDDESESSTSFEKLRNSILTNGGIIHPVILNRKPDGSLLCIEGNTRVALYRNFIDENVAGNWTRILALVHDQMDDNQADAIRLQVHLVGTRPWDPYSKAKYLHHYCRFPRSLTFVGVARRRYWKALMLIQTWRGIIDLLFQTTEVSTPAGLVGLSSYKSRA